MSNLKSLNRGEEISSIYFVYLSLYIRFGTRLNLCLCLAVSELLCSIQIISRLDSKSLCLYYFQTAILVYKGSLIPTWRFHTGLCKLNFCETFQQISPNFGEN